MQKMMIILNDSWQNYFKNQTPLHIAAINNSKEIGDLLISKGADINAIDQDEKTPLFYAAANNSIDIGELLISKGADINGKDIEN